MNYNPEKFIVEKDDGKKQKYLAYYDLISKICLLNGSLGNEQCNLNPKIIAEFWDGDECYPTMHVFRRHIKMKYVRWYIRNEFKWEHDIWNGDFIRGLTRNGRVKWNIKKFPSFYWDSRNTIIYEILSKSIFKGNLSSPKTSGENGCLYFPALCLPYGKDKISYMAGILSGGNVCEIDNQNHVSYPNKVVKNFEDFGIPYEVHGESVTISPFWPSLFCVKMPTNIREIWCGIKKPYRANLFASILCYMYCKKGFQKNILPYVLSRRNVYYKYKSVKNLYNMRLTYDLIHFNYETKELIRNWHKLIKE